jgi:DNA-binding beta-propeller fold protein YncE
METKMANTVGSGQYTYELVERWGTLPSGWTFGPVSAVATDSQDRVYAFQRKDPPVLIFDRLGNYVGSWGDHAITDPHGFYIKNDIVYLTDRDDHVVLKYTLDGKPLRLIGERGNASDTGCISDGGRVLRAAGPFNKPTEMVPDPTAIYT